MTQEERPSLFRRRHDGISRAQTTIPRNSDFIIAPFRLQVDGIDCFAATPRADRWIGERWFEIR